MKITFWYGCNVLRHGDIVHACMDLLRALGSRIDRQILREERDETVGAAP